MAEHPLWLAAFVKFLAQVEASALRVSKPVLPAA